MTAKMQYKNISFNNTNYNHAFVSSLSQVDCFKALLNN